MRLQNVVGVGVAYRQVEGAVTDEPAVRVYVTRKLPRDAVPVEHRVPVQLETEAGEVRTDVVEVGEPQFLFIDDATYRPIEGGCQIGTAGGYGTAGAVMYDRRDQTVVLLTNNHVLTTANPGELPANTMVTQPGAGKGIGHSKRIVPMFLAPLGADFTHYATVDAGIVAVDSNVPVEFNVVEVGRHPFVVLPPYPGLQVVHRGWRTQLREGTVEDVDVSMIYKMPNGERRRIGGPEHSVFSIRAPEDHVTSMKGDSGSLVVDAEGAAARGLVFAASELSGGLTWACELGTIMSLLELDTLCTGSLNALIRRSAFRRLADRWALAQHLDAAGGSRNSFVDELIGTVSRFRDQHLPPEPDGSVGLAIGGALQRLAPDLAFAISSDEDAAGHLDRAFGEWLVQPTVFDMLEYRFSDDVGVHVSAALDRMREICPGTSELSLLEQMFKLMAGRSVREVLVQPLPEDVLRDPETVPGRDEQSS